MAEKSMINGWVIVVVLLVLYAVVPGFQSMVNGLLGKIGIGATTPSGEDKTVPTIPCPIEDTTLTLTSEDKYQLGTDITSGWHRVWVGSTDKGYYAEDATVQVSPGDKVKVAFGLNSTTYYPVIKELTVPCSGTAELHAQLAAMDTTPTFSVWTEEGSVIATTNQQAMDASSLYDNKIRIRASPRASLGDPDGTAKNTLCLQFSQDIINSVKVDGADSAITPNGITSVVGNKTSCYAIPTIPNDPNDGADGEWNGDLITETGTSAPGAADYINITLFDSSVYLNNDTGELVFGVQDKNNNDIGAVETQMSGTNETFSLS